MKQLIRDIQQWLLFEGRCLGCGRSLEDGKREKLDSRQLIVCGCTQIYEYNEQSKVYERSDNDRYVEFERSDANV